MDNEQDFEREVRQAFARVEAPVGFAERVLARTPRRKKRTAVATMFAAPSWRIGYALAAMLAVTAGGIHVEHVRQQQRRAAEAQQQFARAMALTDHALDRVSTQLQQAQIGQFTEVLEGGR